MKTISMPLKEYQKEIEALEEKIETAKRKLDRMRRILKPILDYRRVDGEIEFLSDYTREESKKSVLVYIGGSIQDSVGWS